jgi:hypothetical protein
MHYFKLENRAMVCQIKVASASKASSSSSSAAPGICGTRIRVSDDKNMGTRSGNMKKHLRRFHPNEHEIVTKMEDDETTGSSCKGIFRSLYFFALHNLFAILKQAQRRIFSFIFFLS